MAHHLLVQPVPALLPCSSFKLVKSQHHVVRIMKTLKRCKFQLRALTESSSSSQDPTQPPQSFLQQVSDSFSLPPEYLEQLPNDLRLDLNDAAFDLSNGPVSDECGEELGQLLLNISRAWELADTSTSYSLARKLSGMENSLSENAKAALGQRLLSAGRRFQAIGQYGNGEMQKIAQAMKTAGSALCGSQLPRVDRGEAKSDSRVFKFGELQVAISAEKANVGALIGIVFGVLSWQLGQGVQSIPESSLQYANDNALLLAKSLRGVLLALSYSSAVLSALTSLGLFFLARQLSSKE